MSTEKKPQATLKRQLNPINVWAIAFGCIIGWGSFINPGKKFLPNSGVAGTAIAMLLGALVMLIMGVAIAFGCFVYTSNNAVVTWQSVGGSALRLS